MSIRPGAVGAFVVPTSALASLLALAAGCASVSEQRDEDRTELRELVRSRLGVELATPDQDGDAIHPDALALLESPLDEAAAVKIALLNNREVRAQLARLGVASAELVQAGLLSNPMLSADAKFFDGGTEIEFALVQSFLDVFLLKRRKGIQAAELAATKARVAESIVRLVSDVRRALVDVRAAQRLVAVEREIERAAQASADLMAELHRAGNVTDPELTADQLALARATLMVAQAEARTFEAEEPLNVLLGLWGDGIGWTVEGSLPDEVDQTLDLEDVEARAIAASLDLVAIRAEATAAGRRAGIVGWEAPLGPGELGLAGKREADASEWGLGPAIGFSLPLFDTGAARRGAAAAVLEELQASHVARAVDVRSGARRLRARYVALRDQAEFIRTEELPKAERLVRETLRNYNAMQIGVFGVFAAKQQEIEARRSYVGTLRDAWLARIDLEELMAGSLNDERVSARPRASDHSTTPMQSRAH
jgi:outer membrane protein TolC